MMFTVTQIISEETYPLRQRVLRPGQPQSACVFSGDDVDGARHYGLFMHTGVLVGVATVYPLSYKDEQNAWRLRGMAIDPSLHRQGGGRFLLNSICHDAGIMQVHCLWCHARKQAVGFYEAVGFVVSSDCFEVEGIGPHYQMVYRLDTPFNG